MEDAVGGGEEKPLKGVGGGNVIGAGGGNGKPLKGKGGGNGKQKKNLDEEPKPEIEKIPEPRAPLEEAFEQIAASVPAPLGGKGGGNGGHTTITTTS